METSSADELPFAVQNLTRERMSNFEEILIRLGLNSKERYSMKTGSIRHGTYALTSTDVHIMETQSYIFHMDLSNIHMNYADAALMELYMG
jgi:hypothetical protein